MEVNTAFNILVISLSILLGIFLILSVVGVVLVIKLISSLRYIASKGEQLVDNAEELADTLRRNAGAVSIMKLVMKFVGSMHKSNKE
jgi:cell division septal protein FtsQ